MDIKDILVTGDDGVKAEGAKIMVSALNDDFDVKVSATRDQQSGVGAKVSLKTGGTWGKAEIEGFADVPALWCSGTPVDSLRVAEQYWSDQDFDLLISGINYGANVGPIISSGTFGVAFYAAVLARIKRAIAISYDMDRKDWLHKEENLIRHRVPDIDELVKSIVQMAIENEFWGAPLLNINLPTNPDNNKIMFTKMYMDLNRYFSGGFEISEGEEINKYEYPRNIKLAELEDSLEYDATALRAGYITITPCMIDFTDISALKAARSMGKISE